jgi:hypothetical protein
LILAVGANSPVWKAPEEKITAPEKSYLKAPHMIICHDNSGSLEHVTMFPCGQYPGMDHENCESKYKKFVYSNRFGFSVQRGNGPDDGAALRYGNIQKAVIKSCREEYDLHRLSSDSYKRI